jgi:hypothetical protein
MLRILTLITVSIFVYSNTIYYTIALLTIVLLLLRELVARSCIHTLTMLMLLIVYLGAIIILIGYICAISPNLMINSRIFSWLQFAGVALFIILFLDHKYWSVSPSTGDYLTGYFYSPFGVAPFFLVVIMLFVTLLIVTSQYLAPKGPFRSITL